MMVAALLLLVFAVVGAACLVDRCAGGRSSALFDLVTGTCDEDDR